MKLTNIRRIQPFVISTLQSKKEMFKNRNILKVMCHFPNICFILKTAPEEIDLDIYSELLTSGQQKKRQ